MMTSDAASPQFQRAVSFTLDEEGGYSNDPRDSGGPTNFGITIGTLSHWRGGTCTPSDVRALGKPEAIAIYFALYWSPVRAWALPHGVDLVVFDFGVNAGVGTSAYQLQAAVGAEQDGIIGPITALAARRTGSVLIGKLSDSHAAFYRSLNKFPIYGNGWLGRVYRCQAIANAMVGLPAPVAASPPESEADILNQAQLDAKG